MPGTRCVEVSKSYTWADRSGYGMVEATTPHYWREATGVVLVSSFMGVPGFDCGQSVWKQRAVLGRDVKQLTKINANDIDAEWAAVSALWTAEVLEGAVA